MRREVEIITEYEAFNLLDGETYRTSDTIMLITAIPIIGTVIIIFYFLYRKHAHYLKEVE